MPYFYFEWLQGFFIVHSTIRRTVHSTSLNSLEHCICTTTMANIWYLQVTSPGRYFVFPLECSLQSQRLILYANGIVGKARWAYLSTSSPSLWAAKSSWAVKRFRESARWDDLTIRLVVKANSMSAINLNSGRLSSVNCRSTYSGYATDFWYQAEYKQLPVPIPQQNLLYIST